MSGTFRGQPKKPDPTSTANERNEYIPSFIANKPFYVPDTGEDSKDYLEHQRLQKQQDDSLEKAQWYDRGKKAGPAATKFRKGACENCGALTHKAKDCLQRKRKIGAKFSGRDIAPDESAGNVDLGWDAKRDRWNGYEASQYQQVVDEYQELEAMKKAARGDEVDGEGDKYEEETDMGRQQQNSTRQLRLREDTAKYLLNLDPDSAKYDPKTRSMVDSGTVSDAASALIAEEGFVKRSGDAEEFERAQRYAWEAQEKGGSTQLHLQANPTAGEFLRKQEEEASQSKKTARQDALRSRYGAQPSTAPLQEAAVVESERFVEYDERGRIKGTQKVKIKSKYPEDVYNNNHTSVWGSWWSNFQWGYACCHSTIKNSYCTGDDGKAAFEATERLRIGGDLDGDAHEVVKRLACQGDESSNPTSSEAVVQGDIVPKSSRQDAEKRKRTLDEMMSGATEQELEDYQKKKLSLHDPMAKMLDART